MTCLPLRMRRESSLLGDRKRVYVIVEPYASRHNRGCVVKSSSVGVLRRDATAPLAEFFCVLENY
jgi:hypothetical protein